MNLRSRQIDASCRPCCDTFYVVQVMINGKDIESFDSLPGSTFTALGMAADSVSTLSLTSIGLDDDEWISLIEVSRAPCYAESHAFSPCKNMTKRTTEGNL